MKIPKKKCVLASSLNTNLVSFNKEVKTTLALLASKIKVVTSSKRTMITNKNLVNSSKRTITANIKKAQKKSIASNSKN